MRRALILAGLIVLTSTTPAAAMTMAEARTAARLAVEQSFAGFTERAPTISATCKRRSRYRARCSVRYSGDRLKATVDANVEQIVDGYVVKLGRLR